MNHLADTQAPNIYYEQSTIVKFLRHWKWAQVDVLCVYDNGHGYEVIDDDNGSDEDERDQPTRLTVVHLSSARGCLWCPVNSMWCTHSDGALNT